MNPFKVGQKVVVRRLAHLAVGSYSGRDGIVKEIDGGFCIVEFPAGTAKIHVFDLQAA